MVPGLSYSQYVYLLSLRYGGPYTATDVDQRHCQTRRWVAGGALTDDGLEVLARAMADPPCRPPADGATTSARRTADA
jgi:hypothetical protein